MYKTLLFFCCLTEMLRQKLQGDETVEYGIARLVNNAHAATA